MQPLTLNQAAKAAHKSKAAILEAIRAGRLSATRDDINQWQIDPAELFRVYPPELPKTGDENRDQPLPENHETALFSVKITYLEQQLESQAKSAERERRLLESTIDDLKTDRDHWRQQATALLTHQPEPKEAPTRKEGRGWLWFGLLLIVVASSGAALFGYWWTMQGGSPGLILK